MINQPLKAKLLGNCIKLDFPFSQYLITTPTNLGMNWFTIFINSSVKGYMFQLFSRSKLQGECFSAESPACFTSLDPKGLTDELRTTTE